MNLLRKLRQVLRSFDVLPYEYMILMGNYYGPYPSEHYASIIAGESTIYPFGPISLEQSEKAFSSCLRKGWIRIIKKRDLAEIRKWMKNKRLWAPFNGCPRVGDISFTFEGANLFNRIWRKIHTRNYIDENFASLEKRGFDLYFFATKKNALRFSRSMNHPHEVSIPQRIGPWCLHWWETFPRGYVVRVKEVLMS